MPITKWMHKPARSEALETMRGVVDACADCDSCRFLMDKSCLLFTELYRLLFKGRGKEVACILVPTQDVVTRKSQHHQSKGC